jgi:hypothetical protein
LGLKKVAETFVKIGIVIGTALKQGKSLSKQPSQISAASLPQKKRSRGDGRETIWLK